MNKIKLAIATLVLLVAVVGAYASANSFRAVPVYYVSGETCLLGSADHECGIGSPNCIVTFITGPATPQQGFANRQLKPGSETLYDCILPLDETVPPAK